jgi:hypothetical protein
LQKTAIIGYASKANDPAHPDLCELNGSDLVEADSMSEHFLSWANRLEGSAFHEFLLGIVKALA